MKNVKKLKNYLINPQKNDLRQVRAKNGIDLIYIKNNFGCDYNDANEILKDYHFTLKDTCKDKRNLKIDFNNFNKIKALKIKDKLFFENDFIIYDIQYVQNHTPYYSKDFINRIINNFNQYEWLFNYTNDLYDLTDFINNKIATCPKGLINYLKENNLDFNYENYMSFLLIDYGKKNNINKYFIDFLYDQINSDILNYEPDFIKKLQKIVDNTIKHYNNISDRILDDIFDLYKENKNKLLSILNYDRDLYYNGRLLDAYSEIPKIDIFNKNLQKLNFINNDIYNDYQVIVPQNIMDLIDEGEQQNNCVGYMYNNNIYHNQDYIYFIRKKDNPKHSFITCQYRKGTKDTIQYKKVNNTSNFTNQEIDIIKNITDKIRKHFS